MTSVNVAISFLSHIGFSHSQSSVLMNKMNDDMSRLMVCSNKELIQHDLSLDKRLHLIRAIRCFHTEKWSKYLMNHFHTEKNVPSKSCQFEKLVHHLIKYHIWIIYASWTLQYIRKYLTITKDIDQETIQSFYERLNRLKNAIIRLKQMILLIKRQLS